MPSSEPILSEFLEKDELAAELRRNPRTLDRWQLLGMGPPRTHVGRRVLYRRASVQKWLLQQERSLAARDCHSHNSTSQRTDCGEPMPVVAAPIISPDVKIGPKRCRSSSAREIRQGSPQGQALK